MAKNKEQLILGSTAILIFDRGSNNVLMARRLKDPEKGLLAVAGGKIDFGEDPHTAAWRELTEETGLKVEDIHEGTLRFTGQVTSYVWEDLKTHHHCYWFWCQTRDHCYGGQEHPFSEKGEQWIWRSITNLPKAHLFPHTKPMIDLVRDHRPSMTVGHIVRGIADQS